MNVVATPGGTGVGPMRIPDRVRRMVERLLPWYDPTVEARRTAHSEDVHRRSIAARIEAEDVRAAYLDYARRLHRG